MTQFVIANNVDTQLATALPSSGAGSTTVTLASSANLPVLSAGQVMPLTLNDAATGLIYEVVYVTAISGVTLTVLRAQEGTGAQNWNIGDFAFCAPTQGTVAVTTGNPNNTFLIAPATASQHAVQFGQVAGVVGSVRNLAMSVTAASATATLTADEIIVESALGGLRYCLASFNKTINLATTGAGGMDTGSAPVSGYVAIYAIWNPTTSTAALLATNAATKQGNIYGGANMPSGYTASALLAVWATNGSSQFNIGFQRDRRHVFPIILAFNAASTQASPASVALSPVVPANAISISGELTGSSSSSSSFALTVAADANGSGQQNLTQVGTGAAGNYSLDILTAQTLFWSSSNTAGTPNFNILISAYSI